MTKQKYFAIVKQERKSGLMRPRKGTQMNTIMILSYLKHKRYENALDKKQGFVSAHTFLRARNHIFQGRSGMCRGLC